MQNNRPIHPIAKLFKTHLYSHRYVEYPKTKLYPGGRPIMTTNLHEMVFNINLGKEECMLEFYYYKCDFDNNKNFIVELDDLQHNIGQRLHDYDESNYRPVKYDAFAKPCGWRGNDYYKQNGGRPDLSTFEH